MYALIWIHFIADFILQSDTMALNKSKSVKWLLIHAAVYAIPFLIWGPLFCMMAFITHAVIDFFTSKGTSWLWQRNQRHWFFTLIGFDQALHLTMLFLLWGWLI
jgi:hypothetical protein